MSDLKVSIIIPVSKWNKNLDENISHSLKLDCSDYEIIILPDESINKDLDNRIRIIPTGKIGPAEKRNIGVKNAKGSFIAFADDDIYPEENWLSRAIGHFENDEIAAVGGPAVTPGADSLLQQASGAVYSSLLGGGTYRYRYIPQSKRFVDDFPSCNFIVRKSVYEELGGFQTNFWPGEDTAFCLDIVNKLKKKIVYDPEVLVYHHRRSLFNGHFKQVKAYALHRGYFVKKYPQTSLRLSYFMPSFLLLFILLGWIVNVKLYIGIICFYLGMAFISILEFTTLKLKFLTFIGIIGTHIVYGLGFVKGLLSRKLPEE